jgi:hypothetical protein
MKNLFSNTKNENATSSMMQQPAMFELSEQELEQANGGCGYGRRHRRWHKECRRDHHGREIIVIVVEEY